MLYECFQLLAKHHLKDKNQIILSQFVQIKQMYGFDPSICHENEYEVLQIIGIWLVTLFITLNNLILN